MPGEDDVNKVAELTGQVTDLEGQISELSKMIETLSQDNPDLAKAVELQNETLAKMEELTEALETTVAERDMFKAELELAKAMTDSEKEHCKGMSDDEKSEFMAKPKEERMAAMNKRAEEIAKSDESVTIEGQEIKKSAVGEGPFAVFKKQADRLAKQEATLQAEIEKRETAELQKRADDEFPHVPGSVEERADMLRAISKMDEDLRKSFEAVFTSAEKLAKAGFSKLGHMDGKSADQKLSKAASDFKTKVDEVMARDKSTRTEALRKVRKAEPELFKAYQEQENSTN